MTRDERELRELALNLFSTGRFSSRDEARKAALEQLARRRQKEQARRERQRDSRIDPEGD